MWNELVWGRLRNIFMIFILIYLAGSLGRFATWSVELYNLYTVWKLSSRAFQRWYNYGKRASIQYFISCSKVFNRWSLRVLAEFPVNIHDSGTARTAFFMSVYVGQNYVKRSTVRIVIEDLIGFNGRSLWAFHIYSQQVYMLYIIRKRFFYWV